MSDFRQGICKDCDAQFKIPASFAHDRAKCNQCGGTVEIEPAAAAPAPKKPTAKPIPAKPAPAPKAKATEASGEKPMTMKEKIIARKKAAADAEAAAATPPAIPVAKAKKPAAKAAAKPRASARRGKTADAEEGKTAGRRSGGRKAAGAKGGSRKRGGSRRGGDDEAEAEGGRRGRGKQEKKSPALAIVSVLALVVAGGAGWYFTMGPGSKAEEPMQDDVAVVEPTAEELAAKAEADMKAEADAKDKAEAAAAKKAEDDAAKAAEAAKPKEPKKPKEYKPLEVTYDEYPLFGKAIGTTDEEWEEILTMTESFADLDSGARGPRDGRKLQEMGYKAMPALINKMREFDLGSDGGHTAGDMFQRTLTEILNGRNLSWESARDPETLLPTPRAHMVNRKSTQAYLKIWANVVQDPTQWIGTVKLGTDKYKDQLVTYAQALADDGITEGEFIDLALDALGGESGSSDDDDDEDMDDF
ncbi:MAG: hypothetical protein ACI84E_000782 [Planctomycetota bacterium]|jgi:hypothetical protein